MPKKRKRLKLSSDDKIVGMKPRQKRDLYAGCNEAGMEWFTPDVHVFEKAFCRICKNADCIRAKGAVSPWHTRMADQVDYLLNDPEFSDLTSEHHMQITQQAFEDIGRKSLRLEIARQNQDWEIPPDEGPSDGFDKLAAPDTTDQFDEAAKELARARGKKEPDLPRPQGDEAPAHFQQEQDEEEDPYEYDTQFPSSDGTRNYHVALDKGNKWTCECDGFRYAAKCKHIDTVRSWYEEQLAQAEAEEEASTPAPSETAPPPARAPAPRPQPPAHDPRVPPPQQPVNTPMPQGGVMVGGGGVPADQGSTRYQPPAKDPWSISNDKVVQPGAQVTLKSKKKKP